MSAKPLDLKAQLQLLMDKAEQLGHLLILEADELINQQTLSHQELIQQFKAYSLLKQNTFDHLAHQFHEFGVINKFELESLQFSHLQHLLREMNARSECKQFMEDKLLSRIHALPKNVREPLLLVYTGCLQDIRQCSVWENSPVVASLTSYSHPIWQQLQSTEIVQKQRELELETVARQRLSHVTTLDADTTLDLLSGVHQGQSLRKEKESQSSEKSTAGAYQTDLIFDDTFEIGKNMTLLKGRDLFPVSPTKKPVSKDSPPSSTPSKEDTTSIFDDDLLTKESVNTPVTAGSNAGSSQSSPTSTDNASKSKLAPSLSRHKNKPPLQKLRLDHDKAAIQAELILRNRGLTREHHKIDLIWELIRQRRFGLASLVAKRCDEQEHAPPAWLLRVLALTSSLYLPQGEVYKAIEKELYNFKPHVWAAAHQEDQQALGFLVRAAVLRLSLINPGKLASSILKSFSIKDGEVQLYNFCSRLVYFGQNSPRIGSLLLSQSPSVGTAQEHQGKTVNEDIDLWIKHVRDKILSFKDAALIYTMPNWSLFRSTNQQHKQMLWSYIATTFFLKSIYKVLMSIRNNERGATSRVRQDLNRIREGLNQPQQLGLKLPREFQLQYLLTPAVQEIVQQGLSIADRWLVAETPATTNPVVASQDVRLLKEEVHKRYSLVMQELSQLRFESQTEARALSIDCLMEAFQDIRQLVDQQYDLPPQEINPEHVIHQELLRSPLNDFDEKWQARATPQEQEQAILEMLVQPHLTWVAAMKRIAGRGAWPILHELREIPNLLSTSEQTELEEYLKYVDEPEYRNVMLRLAQLQQEMKQAEHLKLITPEEFQACNWRLMQISEENPAYWQLDELKQEIEYLKKFLDKKRQEEQSRIQARFAQLNQKIALPPGYPVRTSNPLDTISLQADSSQNYNTKETGDQQWIIDL